jgi:twitching motility protein PilT
VDEVSSVEDRNHQLEQDSANSQLLGQLISYAQDMFATDVHVSAGQVPDVVVRGELYALDDAPAVTDETIASWARVLAGPHAGRLMGPEGAVDAIATVGPVRVRCAFRRQRGGLALTARLLPVAPPLLSDLQVPAAVAGLIHRPNGLVIVTGPTGAGKSTLLAALVNEVNLHESKHIMTIEEPVEYLHPQLRSRISQREVGLDCDSFGSALRAALRARPNIVVVGEMRDAETARAAVDAATKGQLVLTTSHAGSASDALEGLVGLFPAGEQLSAAGRLAATLQGVIVQQLLPNVDDSGVVAVREVLLRTSGIVNQIRTVQFNQLYNALQETDEAPGMFRLEDDLLAKVKDGQITVQTALRSANARQNLVSLLEGAGIGGTR